MPSRPERAVTTRYPADSSRIRRISKPGSSSSTHRIVGVFACMSFRAATRVNLYALHTQSCSQSVSPCGCGLWVLEIPHGSTKLRFSGNRIFVGLGFQRCVRQIEIVFQARRFFAFIGERKQPWTFIARGFRGWGQTLDLRLLCRSFCRFLLQKELPLLRLPFRILVQSN